jgi:ribose transport system permease protein
MFIKKENCNIVNKLCSKNFFIQNKAMITFLALFFVMSAFNPYFLTIENLLLVLQQSSINSIIAVGMMFVILTRGIDLSVGSSLALSAMFCASMVYNGFNLVIVFILTLFIGIFLGFISGIIVVKGQVQPFIATLVTMTLFRGLTLLYSQGYPIAAISDKFECIGNGRFFGVPIPVIITAIVYFLAYFILKYTRFGRYVYAVGSNEEATKLAGINISKIKLYVYMICGLLSSLAGLILVSRLSSSQPTAGIGYELDAIAAVVLGGTSLFGGKGNIIGTLMGSLIIGLIGNSLNLLDISSYYQLIVKSIVILIAVLFDFKSRN